MTDEEDYKRQEKIIDASYLLFQNACEFSKGFDGEELCLFILAFLEIHLVSMPPLLRAEFIKELAEVATFIGDEKYEDYQDFLDKIKEQDDE